jgi:hypothetical protein
MHLAFVLILILSLDLVGPAAAHASCVRSQKLPVFHMYCRSVLSSCWRKVVQCGAVPFGAGQSEAERSGAERSRPELTRAMARPKGFVEQLELEALSLLLEFEKAPPCQYGYRVAKWYPELFGLWTLE